MRRVAPKRAQQALDTRLLLIELTDGKCDWCRRPGAHEHHVANGPSRAFSKGEMGLVCFLCISCHQELHSMRKAHAVCIGLALIKYNRPDFYSLELYYKVTRRRWPDESDVEHWWNRMLMAQSRSQWT
jgi:hypothetical protein